MRYILHIPIIFLIFSYISVSENNNSLIWIEKRQKTKSKTKKYKNHTNIFLLTYFIFSIGMLERQENHTFFIRILHALHVSTEG